MRRSGLLKLFLVTALFSALVIPAPGYVPTLVEMSDAELVDGEPSLDVALEPGHGAALLILDAHRTHGTDSRTGDLLPVLGIAGARVVADGKMLGTSDAQGLALCRSKQPIEQFDGARPGAVGVDSGGGPIAERDHLDAAFLAESKAAGLLSLKQHKSFPGGGLRASIYNAMPLAGVQALVAFMNDFRRRRG